MSDVDERRASAAKLKKNVTFITSDTSLGDAEIANIVNFVVPFWSKKLNLTPSQLFTISDGELNERLAACQDRENAENSSHDGLELVEEYQTLKSLTDEQEPFMEETERLRAGGPPERSQAIQRILERAASEIEAMLNSERPGAGAYLQPYALDNAPASPRLQQCIEECMEAASIPLEEIEPYPAEEIEPYPGEPEYNDYVSEVPQFSDPQIPQTPSNDYLPCGCPSRVLGDHVHDDQQQYGYNDIGMHEDFGAVDAYDEGTDNYYEDNAPQPYDMVPYQPTSEYDDYDRLREICMQECMERLQARGTTNNAPVLISTPDSDMPIEYHLDQFKNRVAQALHRSNLAEIDECADVQEDCEEPSSSINYHIQNAVFNMGAALAEGPPC